MKGLLILVVVAELALGGWLAYGRAQRPPAPVTPFTEFNLQEPMADKLEARRVRYVAAAESEDTPAAWTKLAKLCLTVGHYGEAELCAGRALDLDPEHADASYVYAVAADLLGRLEEAIERYERAHVIAPHHRFPYLVGLAHLKLGKADDALRSFHRAAEFPPAAYWMAKTMYRLGRGAGAAVHVMTVVDAHPKSVEAVELRILQARSVRNARALAIEEARYATAPSRLGYFPINELVQSVRLP